MENIHRNSNTVPRDCFFSILMFRTVLTVILLTVQSIRDLTSLVVTVGKNRQYPKWLCVCSLHRSWSAEKAIRNTHCFVKDFLLDEETWCSFSLFVDHVSVCLFVAHQVGFNCSNYMREVKMALSIESSSKIIWPRLSGNRHWNV